MKTLCLLLLASCTSMVTATPTNPSPRPMIAQGSVELFEKDLPTRPYVDVSNFVAGNGTSRSIEELKQRMMDRARAMGCDGVVLGKIHSTTGETTRITGTCVVYTDTPRYEGNNFARRY